MPGRQKHRPVLLFLIFLLAFSFCRAVPLAAADVSAERDAVLDWLRESCAVPAEAFVGEDGITEEQIDALRRIFVPGEDDEKRLAPGTSVYAAALALLSGEYGEEEIRSLLEDAGLDYWDVRHMANALLQGYDQVAKDVIDGKYGKQAARFRALAQNGYDPRLVQQIVNGMLES